MLHRLFSARLAVQPLQRTARWLRTYNWASGVRTFWREHGIALLLYVALSIAFIWPVIPHFTTRIIGGGPDALHNLWVFWHTQQAVLGNQPWFFAPLLYYPEGASLLTHGLGPVTGIFSLPFWLWGPAAAHNGAVLLSLWLTGYCMYLLARGLQLDRGVALFAGIVLMAAPMCLAGLLGNITKVFLGGLPLVLLTLHYALDPRRSIWWSPAVALALLIPLWHSGYQFIFAALGLAFFGVVRLGASFRAEGWIIFKRCILIGLSGLVVVGPFIFAILRAASADINVDLSTQSGWPQHQPDLSQFLLPYWRSLVFGTTSQQIAAQFAAIPTIDKAVALSWTGGILCVVAFLRGPSVSRRWFLFTLLCVILAMGPFVRAFGRTEFTAYNLEIILPYAFLTGLPGFDFMRFSGRFMMIGYVGFGISASFGLAWLTQRFPHQRRLIVFGAIGLILLETWPKPVYTASLPPVPAFYEQIANDQEQYGIFNLPVNPHSGDGSYVIASATYQVYQTIHHKGIAGGYLSRTYDEHPLFPYLMEDYANLGQRNLSVNDIPAGQVIAQSDLARYNYRYVVWHKTNGGPTGEGNEAAQMFIEDVFGTQTPLVDDDLVQVYEIPQTSSTVFLRSGGNWRRSEQEWRWAASPATLDVTSAQQQPVLLQITLAAMHDPDSETGLGERGMLMVEVGDVVSTEVAIQVDQTMTVPLVLPAGTQPITLTLQAGNFRPVDYGGTDTATLSFAIRSINLLTVDNANVTAEILIDGQPQAHASGAMGVFRRTGWYPAQPNAARWATSPAELLIYSAQARTVQFGFTPALLYDPERPDGLGTQGDLRVTVNSTPGQTIPVQAGQPATTTLDLNAGWNTVQLELAAGNFRPSEVQLGNGDQRLLSFALTSIDVVTE